jgi:hypothetical protein
VAVPMFLRWSDSLPQSAVLLQRRARVVDRRRGLADVDGRLAAADRRVKRKGPL